jgi:hypothetical protein
MRGEALLSSTRIRTAPQVPHLHSTVGLGVSSAGGAVGTVSTSGAGMTLSVLCRKAGTAVTSSKLGTQHKFVPGSNSSLGGRRA